MFPLRSISSRIVCSFYPRANYSSFFQKKPQLSEAKPRRKVTFDIPPAEKSSSWKGDQLANLDDIKQDEDDLIMDEDKMMDEINDKIFQERSFQMENEEGNQEGEEMNEEEAEEVRKIKEQFESPEGQEIVRLIHEKNADLNEKAMEVMLSNKYYRKYDEAVEKRIAELNFHYRTKHENISADVYEQYTADFERETKKLERFYIQKTREYEKRIEYRKALMQRYKRNAVLPKLKSFLERQRFYTTCIKWNWTVRKKYTEWTEYIPEVTIDTSLHQRVKVEEMKIKKELKDKKESKKIKIVEKSMSKGPFYELNKMGYEDHPLYSEEDPEEVEVDLRK